MDGNELKKLLKEHLQLEIKEDNSYGTSSIEVKIKYDDDEICSDTYYISRCPD